MIYNSLSKAEDNGDVFIHINPHKIIISEGLELELKDHSVDIFSSAMFLSNDHNVDDKSIYFEVSGEFQDSDAQDLYRRFSLFGNLEYLDYWTAVSKNVYYLESGYRKVEGGRVKEEPVFLDSIKSDTSTGGFVPYYDRRMVVLHFSDAMDLVLHVPTEMENRLPLVWNMESDAY